jgi:hypothetical protein
VQLLGDLPADGEHRDDVGAVEADCAEIVGRYLFDLLTVFGRLGGVLMLVR